MFGALERVTRLNWSAPSTRVLIHVGDAPGHGRRFHVLPGLKDPFPYGDPRGVGFHPSTLIPKLIQETHVTDYVFVRLTRLTDYMVAEFQAIAERVRRSGKGGDGGGGGGGGEREGAWLREVVLDSAGDLMSTAMTSISTAILRSRDPISSAMTTTTPTMNATRLTPSRLRTEEWNFYFLVDYLLQHSVPLNCCKFHISNIHPSAPSFVRAGTYELRR